VPTIFRGGDKRRLGAPAVGGGDGVLAAPNRVRFASCGNLVSNPFAAIRRQKALANQIEMWQNRHGMTAVVG
jgi:hypothetical protein